MIQRIVIAMGAAIVTVAALVACSASGSATTPRPKPSASESAAANLPPLLTGDALSAAFTLPASLTGDDLAKTFVQKIQDWGQYGENVMTQDGVLGYGPDILETQSNTGGATIASALISADHITSPLMSKFVADQIQENIAIADAWCKTYFPDKSKNPSPYTIKEPFNQTLHFESQAAVKADDGSSAMTMDIDFTQNTDLKNTVDPKLGANGINPDDAGFARNGVKVRWRVEFSQENGSTKVVSVIVEPRP